MGMGALGMGIRDGGMGRDHGMGIWDGDIGMGIWDMGWGREGACRYGVILGLRTEEGRSMGERTGDGKWPADRGWGHEVG